MKLNKSESRPHDVTHEGSPAAPITDEQALRRSVMSCLLWESEFYEDGEETAARILRLASKLPAAIVAAMAIETREVGNLRHVPLILLSALARSGKSDVIVADTIARVVQRADELSELLAIHAKVNGVTPEKVKSKISAQMKKGLARAFQKFNEYALAKYDRAGPIRLRDVLFLVHAKPKDAEQEELWARLVRNELKVPDTWEVQLSGGADKKETFERLIREGKLGYLALLRNLRNMAAAGCDADVVKAVIVARGSGAQRVFPFRYIAAARAAPQYESVIDQALSEAIAELPILAGKTVVLVDVSGSMDSQLSGKSDLKRVDAAAALGAIWPGDVRLFTFSNE
ncbi:MAG: TROVE domain-containing protein, partial [Gemmatimonadota bacterium]|nr:TROVE domain-containing protein [Gemmatimonadota bacterium]